MENSVLSWLTSRRYKPVMFQGKPQQVSYVFNVKVTLPR
jgi:hypothetical protein